MIPPTKPFGAWDDVSFIVLVRREQGTGDQLDSRGLFRFTAQGYFSIQIFSGVQIIHWLAGWFYNPWNAEEIIYIVFIDVIFVSRLKFEQEELFSRPKKHVIMYFLESSSRGGLTCPINIPHSYLCRAISPPTTRRPIYILIAVVKNKQPRVPCSLPCKQVGRYWLGLKQQKSSARPRFRHAHCWSASGVKP